MGNQEEHDTVVPGTNFSWFGQEGTAEISSLPELVDEKGHIKKKFYVSSPRGATVLFSLQRSRPFGEDGLIWDFSGSCDGKDLVISVHND